MVVIHAQQGSCFPSPQSITASTVSRKETQRFRKETQRFRKVNQNVLNLLLKGMKVYKRFRGWKPSWKKA